MSRGANKSCVERDEKVRRCEERFEQRWAAEVVRVVHEVLDRVARAAPGNNERLETRLASVVSPV